jgi:hypothetical protein
MTKTFRLTITLLILFLTVYLQSLRDNRINAQEISKQVLRTDSINTNKSPIKDKENLIIPGQSVGRLHLGDSRATAIKLFGNLDTENDYNIETKLNCSERKELRFWELKDKTSSLYANYGNGAWVYLRNDKIDQIKIQSEKIKTAENLTLYSQPIQVRRFYPNIKTFVELNSGADIVGGRNLIFWIDKEKGITFEFQYMSKFKARRLAYIYIFEPKTEFLPEGCIYLETQGWEEIKPFSLEEPKGMQEAWEKRNR